MSASELNVDLFASVLAERDAGFEERLAAADSDSSDNAACYVDYAGAALSTTRQLAAVHALQLQRALANPHSVGGGVASQCASDALDRVRERVLRHCSVSARTHAVVFVANATAAIKLVAHCIAPGSVFVHTQVNHTSVLGLRAVALARGAHVQMLRESSCNVWSSACIATCRTDACPHSLWLTSPPPTSADAAVLVALPAMCNFSGTVYDVESVIADVRSRVPQARVLLDTAAFAATHALDLRRIDADFVCLSMYKLFGYPSGVGCLVAKLDAARHLVRQRDYFGGGTVASLRIDRAEAPLLRGSDRSPFEALEDGTPDYNGIAAVACGFDALDRLGGVAAIGVRARHLAEWLRARLAALRHANDRPAVSLYQCGDETRRASIVAFNVQRGDGSAVGFSEVAALARLAGVQLRTGCFCNIGACTHYLQWREPHFGAMERAQRTCGDDNDVLRTVDESGAPLQVQTGAVRVSFGALSLPRDAERVLAFVQRFFVETGAAPPQQQSDGSRAGATATVSELWIYPIKSCAGVRVRHALPLLRTGLKYDRAFVIFDDQDVYLSQKRLPRLALVQPALDFERETLTLTAPGMKPLELSLARAADASAPLDVVVCGARTTAQFCGTGDDWFSEFLGRRCRLARQPDDALDWRTFQNTSALLLVNQSSVDDLNRRLPADSQIDHRPFRANLVVRADAAFAEDAWRAVRVSASGEPFALVVTGRCNRCQMINVLPDAGALSVSSEPLRTLALYRRARGAIAFGVHLSPAAASVDRLDQRQLKEGDTFTVLA